MPHFYFNLFECGELLKDGEGEDCADVLAARVHAIRAAREVMCHEVKDGRLCLSCKIIIEDENRSVVMSVPFKDAISVSGL